jgi:hypothetical protein
MISDSWESHCPGGSSSICRNALFVFSYSLLHVAAQLVCHLQVTTQCEHTNGKIRSVHTTLPLILYHEAACNIVKFTLDQVVMAQKGSRSIVLLFL